MKRIRILALSLLALFTLGAVAAGTASAEEGVLPPEAFTFKSITAPTLLNLNKEELKCTSLEGSGKFLTEKEKDQHAEGTLDIKGCKALGFSTNTLGDAAEIILVPVLFLICLTNSATLLFGILILPTETVHMEVPSLKALLLIKGAVIGTFTKAGELEGTSFEVSFNEKDEATKPKCVLEGKEFTSSYEEALDTKADVDAFQTGTLTITFAAKVKFMDK